MSQYLLSVYEPAGPVPGPEILDPIMHNLEVLRKDMVAAGAWVFSGGLFPPETATVIRVKDGDTMMTDGPYVEGKEHLGGFTIIEAPDLDAALEWGRRLTLAIGLLPIEVRPFKGDPAG